MNIALFISGNYSNYIHTNLSPSISERIVNGIIVTIMIAPKSYVDAFLRINPGDPRYLKLIGTVLPSAFKNAVLSFYGHELGNTSSCIYLDDSTSDFIEALVKVNK